LFELFPELLNLLVGIFSRNPPSRLQAANDRDAIGELLQIGIECQILWRKLSTEAALGIKEFFFDVLRIVGHGSSTKRERTSNYLKVYLIQQGRDRESKDGKTGASSSLAIPMTPIASHSASLFHPSVSVVIPIYNGEADLPDLLACLRSQTYPSALVEYLLVDNGSTDRTLAQLQSQPQLQALSETQIQSSYAARNTGIRAATGSIIAFTDTDCRPSPEWLAELVQPFADPIVGLVAGEIKALPGQTLLERYADRHETLSQKHTLAHPFCPYGQTANLAVRREIFNQVGLFRPYLTTGGDADLCWRILRSENTSWELKFAATAIVQHRHRTTVAELRSQWQRYGRSNRYLHELHGINLTKEMSQEDYLYRWSKWLLKEVPIAAKNKLVNADFNLLEVLMDTPLSLICGKARAQGQRQARLEDAARTIAVMELEG
jgi:glycosyltransferase involved in cell wall biosynthesis